MINNSADISVVYFRTEPSFIDTLKVTNPGAYSCLGKLGLPEEESWGIFVVNSTKKERNTAELVNNINKYLYLENGAYLLTVPPMYTQVCIQDDNEITADLISIDDNRVFTVLYMKE